MFQLNTNVLGTQLIFLHQACQNNLNPLHFLAERFVTKLGVG